LQAGDSDIVSVARLLCLGDGLTATRLAAHGEADRWARQGREAAGTRAPESDA